VSAVAAEFKYSERKLARCIGLSRDDLKAVRDMHLELDRDWKKVGGEVALNNGGLRRVWRVLEIKPRTLDLRECLILNGTEKNGAENGVSPACESAVPEKILLGHQALPIPSVLRVTRIPDNPSLVICHDLQARLCSVWVGKNENFVVGMSLKAAIGGDGMWRLLGPRPRLRGRWM
jgi:hypothetical protein